MNRTKLKTYAPQARRDFIQAVTDRAAYYSLTAKKIEPVIEKGDIAIIGGKAFPRSIAQKRKALEERIIRLGFEQTMEAMAYTWFNRLVAIRFMELHGYLDHGYRVLSHPEGKTIPEILEHAEHVELPGLDRNKIIDLKLDGTKEAELYRMLLIAQCNALHSAMPFLFERIDDEIELLLPDNLLHSDSLIRKLVNEIDEEDWQEVEIIGWLYQFYISEKKDQVIGKVVKSEDIPAATQLFTPNWIVKYLVQNSLGRQWLATYPNSSLRQQIEYYIEPAEQTPEVQEQLKAITPESLNPEELTLLDPACGSGHILVEAYDLFKAIYQERGYRARDIPTLISQKNLFGLEIDDRAAQLAAFALLMKARADDRRIFTSGVQPNVMALQESKGLNAKSLSEALNVPLAHGEKQGEKGNISSTDVADLINLFEHGKTFGSLIQVPSALTEKLPAIRLRVRDVLAHGDLMMQPAAKVLLPLIEQAWMLSRQYDAVVANPPYMGNKAYNLPLKAYIKSNYDTSRGDLYACFAVRGITFLAENGFLSLITIPNWMCLSSFQELREHLLRHHTFDSFVHNGRGVWGSDFGTCMFSLRKSRLTRFKARFFRLFSEPGSVSSHEELIRRFHSSTPFLVSSEDLERIPSWPLAYWVSDAVRNLFCNAPSLETVGKPRSGITTGDNDRFIRYWFEITSFNRGIATAYYKNDVDDRWVPLNGGSDYRKWYGSNWYVINWRNHGEEITHHPGSTIANLDYQFRPGVTWAKITIAKLSVRLTSPGFIFSAVGLKSFPADTYMRYVCGFLNSTVVEYFKPIFSSTVSILSGDIAKLPLILRKDLSLVDNVVDECVNIAHQDWDSAEISWDFSFFPLLTQGCRAPKLKEAHAYWSEVCCERIRRMQLLEEENNRLFIEAYGLQGELSPEVPEDQITLARPDREEDIKQLISYAIGCMMGRYSLDKPGLNHEKHEIHQKKKRDSLSCDSCISWSDSRLSRFVIDPDGIVPIMDTDWFPDDAANRVVEFISVAWPKEHLEENLKFIADSLSPNRGEQPRDTIRRYLAQSFFKDHLKTYKRRPIYWLFSSGKQRAFQCLVYLHRYHEGTLSRMRTEYVIPLQGKINARIDQLASGAQQATSTSHRKKLEKERDTLRKQQAELQAFDEKLRHYADMRISLDLDDGVRVNYGKFGDLLAEVKAVCGEE